MKAIRSSPPREGQRERAGKAVRTRHVAVLPHVHLLDLSGPVQALFEANGFGEDHGPLMVARVARELVVYLRLEVSFAKKAAAFFRKSRSISR